MLRRKFGAVDVYLDAANAFLFHQVIKRFHGFRQYFFPFNMAFVHLPLMTPKIVESLRNFWAVHVQQPGQDAQREFGQGGHVLRQAQHRSGERKGEDGRKRKGEHGIHSTEAALVIPGFKHQKNIQRVTPAYPQLTKIVASMFFL